MTSAPRHGLLLTNLGTPDSPSVPDVRRYLSEFLWDRHVLDMNPIGRWLLLHAIILRTRPKASAHAYQSIWTEKGSPLLQHSVELRDKVRTTLGPEWCVEIGMRYGNPSLQDGLDRLLSQGPLESLTILPLYPQYATSTTYSSLERLDKVLSQRYGLPPIKVLRDFYEHPAFIQAQAEVARPHLEAFKPDAVLYSFHGVPERHLTAVYPEGCEAGRCEHQVGPHHRCYRAQCYGTARALHEALGRPTGELRVSFQSRLGKIPWIQPYTEDTLVQLGKAGFKRLAVLCPSFTADCIETIEEIGMRGAETFQEAGGEALVSIPCVNSDPSWVKGVVDLTAAAPLFTGKRSLSSGNAIPKAALAKLRA